MSKTKSGWYKIIFWLLCGVLLCVRCFVSFDEADEAFYITGPHRFLQEARNGLFIDEWWVVQVSFVLTEPFLMLYHTLRGGYEGVYLYARLVYAAATLGTGIYLCSVLKRRTSLPRFAVYVAIVLVMFYKRENIEGMSYYGMGQLLSVLSLAFFLDHRYIGAGLAASGMVLCNPYTAVVVVLVGLVWAVESKQWRDLGKLWIGIGAAALVFLFWLMRRQSIIATLYAIPNLLRLQGGHMVSSPIDRIKSWIYIIVVNHLWLVVPAAICLVITSVMRLLRRELPEKLRILYYLYCMTAMVYDIVLDVMGCGNTQVAVTLCGLAFLFSISADRWMARYRVSLYILVIGGMISLCWHMASDTWDVYRIGFSFAQIGAVMVIADCIHGLQTGKSSEAAVKSGSGTYGQSGNWLSRCATYVSILAATVAAVASIACRMLYIYWGGDIGKLNTVIDRGVACGLYTTQEHAERIVASQAQMEEVIARYHIGREHTVYLCGLPVWEYMLLDAACGAYTTWIVSATDEVSMEYFRIHGLPDFIISSGPLPECDLREKLGESGYREASEGGLYVYGDL